MLTGGDTPAGARLSEAEKLVRKQGANAAAAVKLARRQAKMRVRKDLNATEERSKRKSAAAESEAAAKRAVEQKERDGAAQRRQARQRQVLAARSERGQSKSKAAVSEKEPPVITITKKGRAPPPPAETEATPDGAEEAQPEPADSPELSESSPESTPSGIDRTDSPSLLAMASEATQQVESIRDTADHSLSMLNTPGPEEKEAAPAPVEPLEEDPFATMAALLDSDSATLALEEPEEIATADAEASPPELTCNSHCESAHSARIDCCCAECPGTTNM